MTEALLHIIWKYKLLGQTRFKGSQLEDIEIVSVGEHNQDSGPDFFNSKIRINDIFLAGNVEIHVKTSDWLKHSHQNDKSYDNLILHVVYEHDIELLQNQQFNVSVLELKKYLNPSLINTYQSLESSKYPIACGKAISSVTDLFWKSWMDRLAISRLEQKTNYINQLYSYCKQNYEEVLYILLCRSFGFKINQDAFEMLGKSLPYSVLKKYTDNEVQVEALLYGVAGFLDELFEDDYPKQLQNEFEFLKHKHQLVPLKKEIWKFSKTRPSNFPTIRIAQFACLIRNQSSLYHFLEKQPQLVEIEDFFNVGTTTYWNQHFMFDTVSTFSFKHIGKTATHLIIINTIIPYLFFISQHQSNDFLADYALDLLAQLPPEINYKTKEFAALGIKTENALESQAQLYLYDHLCSKKECLKCHVGEFLLKTSC